jgi:hypothetical protein
MFTAKAELHLGIKPNAPGEQTIKAAQDAILSGDTKALGQAFHDYKGNVKGVADEMNRDFQKHGAKVTVNVSDDGQVQVQDMSGAGAYDVSVNPKTGQVAATYDNMGRNMDDGAISVDPSIALQRIGSRAALDVEAADQWQPGMR